MDKNRVIGINNSLPWKLPVDMQWFRKNTLGKPIIMGRKTFESFGARALPQRKNIIITRDPTYKAEGAEVVHSIEDALKAAGDVEEVMVIGGANLYEQMLPKADRLYVTEVQSEFEGDAWFPEIDLSNWKEVQQTESVVDEKNAYACHFITYEKQGV